ncbi:alpha/beta hydrolase [Blautia sp. RD014234]|nr:alpha/beta hydrolase [Blautia parvula]
MEKILLSLLTAVLLMVLCFFVYVSDYYHAKAYQAEAVSADSEDYIVYGDKNSSTGFIFYPGGLVEAESYAPLLDKIAQKDVCCVLVKMPFHLAVFDSGAADRAIRDFPDMERWYIGGHSLGGAMASSYAQKHEDSLKGLVLLAAYPTDTLSALPVLSIYGSMDGVLNREKYKDSIKDAEICSEIIIQGANHAGFGNYGEQKKITRQRFQGRNSGIQLLLIFWNFLKHRMHHDKESGLPDSPPKRSRLRPFPS